MSDGVLEESYARLCRWIARNDCRGWDPYDGLMTRHGWMKAAKPSRLVLTYLNKFSPVNLRPLLGVPRFLDNQGAGMIVSAVLRHAPPADAPIDVHPLVRYLLGQSLRHKYGEHCWNGHPFAVQMRNSYQAPDTPGVIGTEACAQAVLDVYLRTGDPELREVVLSVRRFFLEHLLTRCQGAVFFRYKPTTPDHQCTYNASMVAAAYVVRVNLALELDDGWAELREVYDFLVSRQRPDGSWYYWLDLRNGWEKPQVDFHQGFMLDGLLEYMDSGGAGPGTAEAYRRGLDFYRTHQFDAQGRGVYRYPRRWPVNIHNQAQGILTFTRAGALDADHAAFAGTIARWTVRHMQARDGHFYYVKYPWMTNRIPYMRWNDAAMARALAEHLAPAHAAAGAAPVSGSLPS